MGRIPLRTRNSWQLTRVVILSAGLCDGEERWEVTAFVLGYSQRFIQKLLFLLQVFLQTLHLNLQLDVLIKDEITDHYYLDKLSIKSFPKS